MRWIYYIPHDWSVRPTHVWGDVFLLPDVPRESLPPGFQAIWLTIDALSIPEDDFDREDYEQGKARLHGRSFVVDGANMLVANAEFTLDEFLGWVRVWLLENKMHMTQLVPAPRERFLGTHDHLDFLNGLKESAAAVQRDPTGLTRRWEDSGQDDVTGRCGGRHIARADIKNPGFP